MATALPLGGFLAPIADLPIDRVGSLGLGANQFPAGGTKTGTARRGPGSHLSAGRDLGLTFSTRPIPYGRTGRSGPQMRSCSAAFLATLRRPGLGPASACHQLAPSLAGWSKRLCQSLRGLRGSAWEESFDRVAAALEARPATPLAGGAACWRVLADLVDRQEVASLGLSNLGPRRLGADPPALAAWLPLASLQVQLSPARSQTPPRPVGGRGLARHAASEFDCLTGPPGRWGCSVGGFSRPQRPALACRAAGFGSTAGCCEDERCLVRCEPSLHAPRRLDG